MKQKDITKAISDKDRIFISSLLQKDRRLFVFFILELKSRKIVQYGVTDAPNMLFVRNQMTSFMYERDDEKTYLIHDNSGELKWFDYESVGIKDVSITPYSPNGWSKTAFSARLCNLLNAYAERFVKSVRRECLDHFIVMNMKHLRNLMKSYVSYYNQFRPHQGIENRVPEPDYQPQNGVIKRQPVLFGLHSHYYRKSA